jgi:hypothetical protein
MEPNQKISALLAEYNTLRAEVIAARGYVMQAIGITVPVVMGLIGLTFSTSLVTQRWIIWAIAGSAVVYLCITFLWNEWNTRKFTKQIRILERRINDLAGGEELLTWESKHGWGSIVLPSGNKPQLPPHSN